MQIAKINLISYSNLRRTDCNRQYDGYRNRLSVPISDTFQKTTSSPSFTSFITTQREFRSLPGKRIIHCIYCNRPMIPPEQLKDFSTRGVLSGNIENFVKEIKPYRDCLKPSIREVLDRVEAYAEHAPQTHLSRVIQVMHHESLVKLRKKQEPIFKEFAQECRKLPKRYKPQMKEFLNTQYCKLMGLPHSAEFSGKEFTYKLERMLKTVKSNTIATKIIQTAAPLKHECFKYKKCTVPDKIFNQIFPKKDNINNHYPVNKNSMQLAVIERVKKLGEKLYRQDIITLCRNSEKMLLDQKVIVPFSNKTFRYDFDEIVQGLQDKKLYTKLVKIINKLPTSSSDTNSFITKHKYSDSETIGYYMLYPSTSTIEHLHPSSLGGANKMYNWALACPVDNNNRQHHSMKKFLEKFDYKNPQRYFNDIIDAVNAEEISLQDAMGMKCSIMNESGIAVNFSHLKNETLVNTFGYKNPQKKFDEFIELANENIISCLDIIELQNALRTRCGIKVSTSKMNYFFT